MFPDVAASNTATCVTVPKDAVAVANSTAALFDVVAPDVVKLTGLLAYAVPEVDTSVPPPVSPGAAVNNAK